MKGRYILLGCLLIYTTFSMEKKETQATGEMEKCDKEKPTILDISGVLDRANIDLKARYTARCIQAIENGEDMPLTLDHLPDSKKAESILRPYATSIISTGKTFLKGLLKLRIRSQFQEDIKGAVFDFYRRVPSKASPHRYEEIEAPALFEEWQQPHPGVDISQKTKERCNEHIIQEGHKKHPAIFLGVTAENTFSPIRLALTCRLFPETVEKIAEKQFILHGAMNQELRPVVEEKFPILRKAACTWYSCEHGLMKPNPEYYDGLISFLQEKYPDEDVLSFPVIEGDFSHVELTKKAGFRNIFLPKELAKK